MGILTPEYWRGLPCPPPGDLPNLGVEARSPALQGDSLPSEAPGRPKNTGVGSLSHLQGIFLSQESKRTETTVMKVSFVMLMRWLLEGPSHLSRGAGCQGNPDVFSPGWNFSLSLPFFPHFQGGERGWRLVLPPMAGDLINAARVREPPWKPKRTGCRQRPGWWTSGREFRGAGKLWAPSYTLTPGTCSTQLFAGCVCLQ